MKRVLLSAAIAVGLSGCGGSEPVPAPSETPTSYYLRKADLYREVPNDICRTKDAAFLQDLVQRVSAALPAGTQSFDFEDFNAHSAFDGKGMEAVLRFRAGDAGDAVMMYAVGPFDPSTCHVGRMKGGVGADPHDPRSTVTFAVE